MPDKIHEMAERISKELADRGLLIEAGWQIYRSLALRNVQNIPELDRFHEAWQASASHLFTSIMQSLDPGTEETTADLMRMDLLHRETQQIEAMLRLKYGRAVGSA